MLPWDTFDVVLLVYLFWAFLVYISWIAVSTFMVSLSLVFKWKWLETSDWGQLCWISLCNGINFYRWYFKGYNAQISRSVIPALETLAWNWYCFLCMWEMVCSTVLRSDQILDSRVSNAASNFFFLFFLTYLLMYWGYLYFQGLFM